MAIKNPFDNRTESMGSTNEIACPSCGRQTCMRLFRNYDVINYIAFLKEKDTQLGIAVCPKCACAFTVNGRFIEALLAGQTVFLTPDDLMPAAKGL